MENSSKEVEENSRLANVSCNALRGIIQQLQRTHDMISDHRVKRDCEDVQLRLLALVLTAESTVRAERSNGLSFNNLLNH